MKELIERIEGAEGLATVDAWVVKQIAGLSGPLESHVMNGGSVDTPGYRYLLGQHTAFSRLRSFIHGAKALKARGE